VAMHLILYKQRSASKTDHVIELLVYWL